MYDRNLFTVSCLWNKRCFDFSMNVIFGPAKNYSNVLIFCCLGVLSAPLRTYVYIGVHWMFFLSMPAAYQISTPEHQVSKVVV